MNENKDKYTMMASKLRDMGMQYSCFLVDTWYSGGGTSTWVGVLKVGLEKGG